MPDNDRIPRDDPASRHYKPDVPDLRDYDTENKERRMREHETQRYIGDAVYASWDSRTSMLTLDTRASVHNNVIHLEPEVLQAMVKFLRDVGVDVAKLIG